MKKRETTKIPDNFKKFSPRFLRAFRRIFDHIEEDRAKVTDITKYMKDKWLDTKISHSKSSPSVGSSFRVSKANSDHDSTKYINHKESRHSVDEKGKQREIKRLMSTFGIHKEKNVNLDESDNRVNQWLQENESNFKRFDLSEEDLDLTFWRKNSSNET